MQKYKIKKAAVILAFLSIWGMVCTIPFVFESPSIFYKVGLDKILLRAGKVAGIAAAFLIGLQFVLAGRLDWLETIFTSGRLMKTHKMSGRLIIFLILIHAFFVLGADDFVFFPMEEKYWPEFVGIGLAALIAVFVGLALWQKQSRIPYKAWRLMHRIFAGVILAGLLVHIVNVSSSFASGLPFWGTIVAMSSAAVIPILNHFKK